MEKELLFKSYTLLFDIEITLVSMIEKEMTTHYGHLWRQIFFAEGGTHLYDNLPLLFRLYPLQDIFTDNELHNFCILADIKSTLEQQSNISKEDFNHLKYVSQHLNRKKASHYPSNFISYKTL